MERFGIFLIRVVAMLVTALSLYAVFMFLNADPPNQPGHNISCAPMPSHWEAGVCTHGKYFEWYLIRNHPFLFVLSLAGFVAGVAGLIASRKKL
jgi:hypothetical protein